ncbi:hypothetical protein [Halosimplex sp. TS25]|uniref:DUF7331 family protein n=1 Tax=Halosimplex rarum TaxID=3396619 RepID=UPI0039E7C38D
METTDESADGRRPSEPSEEHPQAESPEISAYSTTETKTVFTESDNGDGWIATDLTVDVRQ